MAYRPFHVNRIERPLTELFDDLDYWSDYLENPPSPIQSLPVEVLSEIFQCCLPTDHIPVLSSSEAPILLTQVCSLWRHIALSLPTLWTAIHIPIPSSVSDSFLYRPFGKSSEGAMWWLSHVRRLNCSLTLSLHWPASMSYTFGRGEDFVRAIINASSHFVRELDLHLPNEVLRMVLNKPTTIFPRLEKVTLRRGSDIEGTCLWETPLLRKVVWDGVEGNVLEIPLKWDLMEEISMEGTSKRRRWFNYSDTKALLQGTSRSLRKFGIQLADSATKPYSSTLVRAIQNRRADGPEGVRELYLPQLEVLTVVVDTTHSQHSAPRLLKSLRVPSLRILNYAHHRELSLTSINNPLVEPHPLFLLLSVQTQPVAITTFIIDATSLSRTMFLGCVRLMPSLERLWLKDNHPSTAVLAIGSTDEEVVLDDLFLGDLLPTFCYYDIPIDFSYDYDLLCPRLTDVRFDRAWFTLDALANFVQTRLSLAAAIGGDSMESWVDDVMEAPQVSRLKSIHVAFAFHGSPGARFEDEMRESNVSVNISFATEDEDHEHVETSRRRRSHETMDPKDGLMTIDDWMY